MEGKDNTLETGGEIENRIKGRRIIKKKIGEEGKYEGTNKGEESQQKPKSWKAGNKD